MGMKLFGAKPKTVEEAPFDALSLAATAAAPDPVPSEPSTSSVLDVAIEPAPEAESDALLSEGTSPLEDLTDDEGTSDLDTPASLGDDDLGSDLLDIFTDDDEVDEARLRLANSLPDVSIDWLLAYTRSIIVILRHSQ